MPGNAIVPTGGNSAGLQFIKVNTRRVGQMLDDFDTLRTHVAYSDRIVPGHDPLVMQRYPAPSPDLEGFVVRLDVAPIKA